MGKNAKELNVLELLTNLLFATLPMTILLIDILLSYIFTECFFLKSKIAQS